VARTVPAPPIIAELAQNRGTAFPTNTKTSP
jgi:hypothetical protein